MKDVFLPHMRIDSNLKPIQRNFLEHVVPSILNNQIDGINEESFIDNESKSKSDYNQTQTLPTVKNPGNTDSHCTMMDVQWDLPFVAVLHVPW